MTPGEGRADAHEEGELNKLKRSARPAGVRELIIPRGGEGAQHPRGGGAATPRRIKQPETGEDVFSVKARAGKN